MNNVLVVSASWLGDAVMSMPALQAWQQANPEARITVLAKRGPAELWRMHSAPAEVLTLGTGPGDTWEAVNEVRQRKFTEAFILPHSFRSAVVPFLAGVPVRRGMPGHFRDWMLTSTVPADSACDAHQSREYGLLFGVDELPLPVISIPATAIQNAREKVALLDEPFFGLVPGAARGPSKRWPETRFVRLGRMLRERLGGHVLVFGSPAEQHLCSRIAREIGAGTVNFAGKTNIAEWAALMQLCRVVVCNDSGGMHLAAAAGVPVAAVFGITDPRKTGPLGRHVRILQNSGIQQRDISRHSEPAVEALKAISPEQVFGEVQHLLQETDKTKRDTDHAR